MTTWGHQNHESFKKRKHFIKNIGDRLDEKTLMYEIGWTKNLCFITYSDDKLLGPFIEFSPKMFNELIDVHTALEKITKLHTDEISERLHAWLLTTQNNISDLIKKIDTVSIE